MKSMSSPMVSMVVERMGQRLGLSQGLAMGPFTSTRAESCRLAVTTEGSEVRAATQSVAASSCSGSQPLAVMEVRRNKSCCSTAGESRYSTCCLTAITCYTVEHAATCFKSILYTREEEKTFVHFWFQKVFLSFIVWTRGSLVRMIVGTSNHDGFFGPNKKLLL